MPLRALIPLVLLGGCSSFASYGDDVAGDTDAASDTDPTDTTDDGGGGGGDTDDTQTPDDTDDGGGGGGGSTTPTLILVEIAGGAGANGLRYVELFNPTGAAVELGGWALNSVRDGDETNTFRFPAFRLTAGSSFVVSDDNAAFQDAFGRDADAASDLIVGDGNDTYVLLDGGNRPIDVYGAFPYVDGSGTAWEYTGGVAKRDAGLRGGSGLRGFSASDWTITGGFDDANPYDRQ